MTDSWLSLKIVNDSHLPSSKYEWDKGVIRHERKVSLDCLHADYALHSKTGFKMGVFKQLEHEKEQFAYI